MPIVDKQKESVKDKGVWHQIVVVKLAEKTSEGQVFLCVCVCVCVWVCVCVCVYVCVYVSESVCAVIK